jgi:hypothetical protein
MNDNKFVQKFQQWADKKEIASAIVRSEIPVLKVPTNYIGRYFITKYGLIRGILGKGRWESKDNHFPGIAELVMKGSKGLTEQQANLLGKTLTLGSMGAAFFTLGYLGRNNIQKNDDGSYNIFGVRIGKNLLHSPEIDGILSGANTGHDYDENKGSWLEEFVKSDAEVISRSPFMSMLKYGALPNIMTDLGNFATGKTDWGHTKTDIQNRIFKKVTDMAIPGVIKQPASWMDTKEGFSLKEKPIQRKPEGDWLNRFWQTFEMNIPGLRQNVPEAHYKPKKEKRRL